MQEEQQVQQEQSTQGLTLQDLVLVAQIIQVSTQKGVFRAEDLLPIGSLYNRLLAFLESTGAISRAPAQQQETATPPAEEPAPEKTTAKAKETKNAKARR